MDAWFIFPEVQDDGGRSEALRRVQGAYWSTFSTPLFNVDMVESVTACKIPDTAAIFQLHRNPEWIVHHLTENYPGEYRLTSL